MTKETFLLTAGTVASVASLALAVTGSFAWWPIVLLLTGWAMTELVVEDDQVPRRLRIGLRIVLGSVLLVETVLWFTNPEYNVPPFLQ